jgi:alkylated DNA repair dioxygenase AlkB
MLFDAPLIPGLAVREEILSATEEEALIAAIAGVDLSPFRFQGFTGKRLTQSFGWRYDFDNGRFAETDPIPDWLVPVRDRAAVFAGLDPAELVQVLVIRYDPGAGIGWHRDRPVFDQVVGVSLVAPAILTFRQRTANGFRRLKLPLAPRSAYHLSGEVRSAWEHGIASHDELRYSVTFRSLA